MAFKVILTRILEEVPGITGAVVVDWDGETVEDAVREDTQDLRLIGAHGGVLLRQIENATTAAIDTLPREVVLRTDGGGVVLIPLVDQYVLAVCFTTAVPAVIVVKNLCHYLGLLVTELEV